MNAFIRSKILRNLVFAVFCGGLAAGAGASLSAQEASAAASAEDSASARKVREEFMKVLKAYPPEVAKVLKLDSTLIAQDAYLAPYPAIVKFLVQHPEVRRSPAYYLGPISTGDDNYSNYYYDPQVRAWNDITEGITIFAVVATIAYALTWLLRTAIDYRRWGRLAKVQAEAHTKLLDRFTGNDELLAYVQSSAGARFLKSAPIMLDGAPKAMAAPLARIMWSMQAGVVLAAAGIGLNYVSRRIEPNHADPIFMFSVLLLSIGVGFFVSAGISFVMSKRLGLLNGRPETEES